MKPKQFMTANAEQPLAEACGSWAIIRKGRLNSDPKARRFASEQKARDAWNKLDVRQGWAALIDPDGTTVMTQSGPFSVRTRW